MVKSAILVFDKCRCLDNKPFLIGKISSFYSVTVVGGKKDLDVY